MQTFFADYDTIYWNEHKGVFYIVLVKDSEFNYAKQREINVLLDNLLNKNKKKLKK